MKQVAPTKRLILLASSLLFAWPLGARADRAPEPPAHTLADELTGPSKSEYTMGRILYRDGDFAGALVKFQHAFDLARDPRLLWNMAACEKSLRHYARALRLIERYQREGGQGLTEADRTEARDLERTMRSLVSNVRVTVNQSGATVLVDDEVVGTTPLESPIVVDLGPRRIRVQKQGFKDQILSQEVTGQSEITIAVALERDERPDHDERPERDARLTIAAHDGDAIAIDGKVVGQTRWEGHLSGSTHAVRVTAQGMKPYAADIALREGETRGIDVSLEPESHGIHPLIWIAGGVVAAAGLGAGAYFLFKPGTTTGPTTIGTMAPGTVPLP